MLVRSLYIYTYCANNNHDDITMTSSLHLPLPACRNATRHLSRYIPIPQLPQQYHTYRQQLATHLPITYIIIRQAKVLTHELRLRIIMPLPAPLQLLARYSFPAFISCCPLPDIDISLSSLSSITDRDFLLSYTICLNYHIVASQHRTRRRYCPRPPDMASSSRHPATLPPAAPAGQLERLQKGCSPVNIAAGASLRSPC